MRRMITDEQINLIEELNKYLAFEENHSLTVNTPVSFEEPVLFSNGLGTSNIVNPDEAGDIYLNDEGITLAGLNTTAIVLDNGEDENNYITLNAISETNSISISAYSGLELSWDDVGSDNLLKLTGHLPTSDPEVEGAVWNDNGVLKISAGE